VAQHTTHSFNYKEWRWMTEPPKNFKDVVEYLSTRPLAEAPDLHEDCHLRSYAGDLVGRGAGVYDCASDMFFPYVLRSNWDEMAQYVTSVRRRADPTYECTPPSPSAVCVVHFDIPFPYDIFAEVSEQARVAVGLSWRNAEEYECRCAADRLDAPALGDLLCTLLPLPHSNVELVDSVVGLSWQRIFVAPPDDWVEICDDDLRRQIVASALTVVHLADRSEHEMHIDDADDIPLNSYVRVNVYTTDAAGGGGSSNDVAEEWVYVPLCTPARRKRATVSVEHLRRLGVATHKLCGHTHVSSPPFGCRWSAMNLDNDIGAAAAAFLNDDANELVSPALASMLDDGKLEFEIDEWTSMRLPISTSSFVRSRVRPNVRYVPLARRHFRVDTGRTWLECDAAEVDQIYTCQKFTVHDRFMLYALKGRMFFEVGERDTHEMTLFLEGIGGCGKSTVLKVQQQFWPPHLRGILSSNMQPQFGMSAVAKAKAIFCNEVSAELSIVQEEWQTSVSGEWGSYAVKFKEPLVLKWVAQHFWVGNSFPTKFKNQQGQVSRRLAGVLMSQPVAVRDSNITKKMLLKLGSLQRKEVLAYSEFVYLTGSIDPMSQPDKLPPAFADYYRQSRRATDPVEDFLSEGSFVRIERGKKMLMTDFKELYTQYRLKYDLGKPIKWTEATYRTPFNERGLVVKRETRLVIDNVEHRNVDVIYNLAAVND